MKFDYEIIKITPLETEEIDYDMIIFKVNVSGSITIENSSEIPLQLNPLIKGGALKLLIDIKDLEHIDSSGIGSFINVAKQIRSNNGNLVFANVPQDIKNVFKVINLQNFIEIFNTDVEAANHFRYIG